ncbi:hypothetical protein [Paenibacillus sp. CMAA1364]
MLDIETVWSNVLKHQGNLFRQIPGGEFTYEVKGNLIYPDRTNVQISKNLLQEALTFFPQTNTTKIQHLRGPSYIYAILMDHRITS